ncbi:MAG TPA: O-antigen ligase family protein [Bryobacteraceae bacterium]|nr:O-antigen ligase family protein [Bryobacteraceae bacterium]
MNPQESFMSRAARWLTFGAAAAIMFSIAAFNILMGLALAALLFSGEKLRLPRIKLPLAIFLLLTLTAWVFSPDPWMDGYPQIRKFWVFCILLLVFSTLRSLSTIRWLFLTWAAIGSISALRGFVQFAGKVQQAHQSGVDFYNYYVTERITGFTSHWNTYSAEEMFALVMVTSLLLFGGALRRRWIWLLCASLIAVALYLGETRAVWIATALAGLYLAWFWRRWLVAALPVAAVAVFLLSPPAMRERFSSLFRPRQVDSNQFRIIAWNAGIQMIEKHPLLGLGPEGPKYHFKEYVPPDTWDARPEGFYEHLHNIYLQYGAERGIPALLVFLWLMGQIVWDFARGLRTLPPGRGDRRYLLHGGIAMVLAILAEGVAEVNLGDSEILTMFLVVVAAGYVALESGDKL